MADIASKQAFSDIYLWEHVFFILTHITPPPALKKHPVCKPTFSIFELRVGIQNFKRDEGSIILKGLMNKLYIFFN